MRKLKIASIIFFSGVAICLCAILFLSLERAGQHAGEGDRGRYHLVMEQEIPMEEVLNIDYGMTFNDVLFYPGEGDSVVVREYLNFEPKEKQISTVDCRDGEILVKGVSRRRFAFFTFHIWDGYTEIYLPGGFSEGLEELSVKTAAGDVRSEIPLWEAERVFVNSTSGDISFSELRTEELRAFSTSGDIRLETLTGQISVSTTSGDISLGQTEGNAKVSSTSGEILVGEVQGDVTVSTTSGDISMGKIQGDINFSTTSGNIRLQEGKGQLEGESTSGDVRLDLLDGGFQVKSTSGEVTLLNGTGWGRVGTISGDVRAYLDELTGDLTVSTTSGEVELGLPESASLTLDFNSTSGECNTFFDEALQFNKRGNQVQGQYGGGKNEVSVSTVSGDLRITAR